MTNSQLIGTSFKGARLSGVDFQGANLYGADFTDAETTEVSFLGANIIASTGISRLGISQNRDLSFFEQVCQEIRDQLSTCESIKEISVFGSWADGTSDRLSDIDLFVIGEIDKFNLRGILRSIEQHFNCEINELLWPSREPGESRQPSFILRVLDKPMLSIFRRT